ASTKSQLMLLRKDGDRKWEVFPQSLAVSRLSAERQREGDVRRQASKRVHLTALFADHGMHTSTPNHAAVNGGGLSMERHSQGPTRDLSAVHLRGSIEEMDEVVNR
ncbi:hypothetical protein NQZ68_042234, partial [Dissostichus eleginoides]